MIDLIPLDLTVDILLIFSISGVALGFILFCFELLVISAGRWCGMTLPLLSGVALVALDMLTTCTGWRRLFGSEMVSGGVFVACDRRLSAS